MSWTGLNQTHTPSHSHTYTSRSTHEVKRDSKCRRRWSLIMYVCNLHPTHPGLDHNDVCDGYKVYVKVLHMKCDPNISYSQETRWIDVFHLQMVNSLSAKQCKRYGALRTTFPLVNGCLHCHVLWKTRICPYVWRVPCIVFYYFFQSLFLNKRWMQKVFE